MKIKVCLTIIFLIGLLIGVSNAIVDNAVEKTLSTSYAKVSLTGSVPSRCVPIAVWTADGTSFYIASDSSGTGEKLIPADIVYSNDCVKIDSDGGILWAKASSGTPVLYVDIGRDK